MSTPQPPAEEPSEARIANELHRRFCSDVPNDGTYTLACGRHLKNCATFKTDHR
jgi:hypothetical protein